MDRASQTTDNEKQTTDSFVKRQPAGVHYAIYEIKPILDSDGDEMIKNYVVSITFSYVIESVSLLDTRSTLNKIKNID